MKASLRRSPCAQNLLSYFPGLCLAHTYTQSFLYRSFVFGFVQTQTGWEALAPHDVVQEEMGPLVQELHHQLPKHTCMFKYIHTTQPPTTLIYITQIGRPSPIYIHTHTPTSPRTVAPREPLAGEIRGVVGVEALVDEPGPGAARHQRLLCILLGVVLHCGGMLSDCGAAPAYES